jgi:hypothetical protein
MADQGSKFAFWIYCGIDAECDAKIRLATSAFNLSSDSSLTPKSMVLRLSPSSGDNVLEKEQRRQRQIE